MTTTEQFIPNINEELLELLNRTDEEILQRLQQQKDQETDEQRFAVNETRTEIKKLIAEFKENVEKLQINNIEFQRYIFPGKTNQGAAPKYIFTYMINKSSQQELKKFKSAKSLNAYNLRFFLIDTHNDLRHTNTHGQPIAMLANLVYLGEQIIRNNLGFNQEIDQLVSLQLLINFLQKIDKDQASSRLYFKFENYKFMQSIIQQSRYRALLEREYQLMTQMLLYCFIKDIVQMSANQSVTNNFTINPTFLIYAYFLRLAQDQDQSITQDVTTLVFMFLNQYLKDIPVRINYIKSDSIHNRENYMYCLYRAFELATNTNKKFMDVAMFLQPFYAAQTSAEFVQAKYIVSKFMIEKEHIQLQKLPLHTIFDKILQSRISYLQASFALQVKSTTNAKRFLEEQNTYVQIARSAKYALNVYRYYDVAKTLIWNFDNPNQSRLEDYAMITPTITYFQLYKIYEVFTGKIETGPDQPIIETPLLDDKFYLRLDRDYHNLFLSAKMDYVFTKANAYIVTDLGFYPLYLLPFSDQTVYYSGIEQILSYNQQARSKETIENYIQQAQNKLISFIQDFNDIQMAIYTQFGETTITKKIDDPKFQIDSTYRCLQLIRSLYALQCICDYHIQSSFINDVIGQLQSADTTQQLLQEEMNEYSSAIEKPQPSDFQIEVETVNTRNRGFILKDQAEIQKIERKLVEFDTENIYQQHQDFTLRLFSLDQDIYFIFQILVFAFQQTKIVDRYQINTISPFLFDKNVLVIFDEYFDVFKEQVQLNVAADDLRLQYHIQKKKISFYISQYGQDVLSDILTNQKFFKMKKALRKIEGRQEIVEEQLIQLREVQQQYNPQVIEQTLDDLQNIHKQFEIKVRTEYETQIKDIYDKVDGIISKIQTQRQKMTQFSNYSFNGSFPYGGYGQVVKDMYTTVKQAEQMLQLPDISQQTQEALDLLNKTLVTAVEDDTKFRGVLSQQIEQLKIETTAELSSNPIRNRYWAQKFAELRKISLQVVSQINNTVELFGQKSDLSKISSFNAYQVLADKFIQDQLHEKQRAEEKASRQKNLLTPMNKLAMIAQQTDQPPVWKPTINEIKQDDFKKRFLQPGIDPVLAQQLRDQYFITVKADKQTVAEAQQIIFDNLMARRFMGEANKQLSQLGNYVKAVIQEDEVD